MVMPFRRFRRFDGFGRFLGMETEGCDAGKKEGELHECQNDNRGTPQEFRSEPELLWLEKHVTSSQPEP